MAREVRYCVFCLEVGRARAETESGLLVWQAGWIDGSEADLRLAPLCWSGIGRVLAGWVSGPGGQERCKGNSGAAGGVSGGVYRKAQYDAWRIIGHCCSDPGDASKRDRRGQVEDNTGSSSLEIWEYSAVLSVYELFEQLYEVGDAPGAHHVGA
ncbi:hypothetical protein OJ253_3510 [Cryptosporidium canis]|uniref:Uncharacterized protein n=1 Tax=Cryptosporidium canis TaxID=195482 RepID=A0A9D5DED8_9CRYT|nr:hypothetical protein OJ253_3510 [Cryptosporidium canis]